MPSPQSSRWSLASIVLLLVGACASEEAAKKQGPGDPAANEPATTGNSGGSAGAAGASCGPPGEAILALSSANELLRFNPGKKSFSKIGVVACDLPPKDAFLAMALDRVGKATLRYQSGYFQVDITDASCTDSPLKTSWIPAGMTYVGAPGSDSESLFLVDQSGKGLGRIDGENLTELGGFDQGFEGRNAAATGLGDGRLFAFFVNTAAQTSTIAEVASESGKIKQSSPQPFPPLTHWAFAHWGGYLYFFTSNESDGPQIHRALPGKSAELYLDKAAYTIVGATSSSCAPTQE